MNVTGKIIKKMNFEARLFIIGFSKILSDGNNSILKKSISSLKKYQQKSVNNKKKRPRLY